FVYRNNARTLDKQNHYLQVGLEGSGPNRFAVGAKVTVQDGAARLYQEVSPSRGFQSSSDYLLTFGLGKIDTVKSVTVDWPDGQVRTIQNVAANQRITVKQSQSSRFPLPASHLPPPASRLLTVVTRQTTFPFVHHENDYVDFDRERLMPKMLSTEGPLMAVADVNGDGLDDVFI